MVQNKTDKHPKLIRLPEVKRRTGFGKTWIYNVGAIPASRATSRKLKLAKLRSALSWLNAASTSERRVFSFCSALTPITMSESFQ